jgi:hypothetical protein
VVAPGKPLNLPTDERTLELAAIVRWGGCFCDSKVRRVQGIGLLNEELGVSALAADRGAPPENTPVGRLLHLSIASVYYIRGFVDFAIRGQTRHLAWRTIIGVKSE